MITLERALEGGPVVERVSSVWLLANAIGILHELVALLALFLAAPNPPGNESKRTKNNSTANADHHANDRILRLGGHAGGFVAAIVGETGC